MKLSSQWGLKRAFLAYLVHLKDGNICIMKLSSFLNSWCTDILMPTPRTPFPAMAFLGKLLQLSTFRGRCNQLFPKQRIKLLTKIKLKKWLIIKAFVTSTDLYRMIIQNSLYYSSEGNSIFNQTRLWHRQIKTALNITSS